MIDSIIIPKEGERQVHGNASFNPNYLERVFDIALKEKKGIVFIHSHPFPGWQDMSPDDIKAETMLAPRVSAVTELPLVGMTIGNDYTWSARFWEKNSGRNYKRTWCNSVRVIGKEFSIYYADYLMPSRIDRVKLLRTISAWGEATQENISRITVGVIGAGSVGSIIAETLARMGINNIKLIDFDDLELKNLDRTNGATINDVGHAKVKMLSKHIGRCSTALNFKAEAIEYSICEEEGFRYALDCDILFSCVDRPWPRFVLNFIAFAHLIPVIDGGIKENKSN